MHHFQQVSPPVGLRIGGFMVGQDTLKVATCKVTKHEKSYMENQHALISFVFDTFRFLVSDATKLLNKVRWIMYSIVMSPRSMDVILKKVHFIMQRGLAVQLVVHLSSHSLYHRRWVY